MRMSTSFDGIWEEHVLRWEGDDSEKTYYIIRRDNDTTGVFSNYCVFADGIRYAIDRGYIPVIDMQNYPNPWMDSSKIGMENAWEYFFQQPFGISLEEAYAGKRVLVSGRYPGIRISPLQDTEDFLMFQYKYWRRFSKKYLRLQTSLEKEILAIANKIFSPEDRILGLHIRGTDYTNVSQTTKYPGHHVQPPLEIVIKKAKEVMRQFNCDKIFLSTEDEKVYKKMKETFKDVCITTNRMYTTYDVHRHTYINFYRNDERKNDPFHRQKEYLTDIIILTKCKYLISGRTSALAGLMMLTDGYDYVYTFDFGLSGIKQKTEDTEYIRTRQYRPYLCYETCILEQWMYPKCEGMTSGNLKSKFGIQSIRIYFSSTYCGIFYTVYSKHGEWSEEVTAMTPIGSTGSEDYLLGVKIRLNSEGEHFFSIQYRLHGLKGQWSEWKKNGEACVLSEPFNAMEIAIENLTGKRNFDTEYKFEAKSCTSESGTT